MKPSEILDQCLLSDNDVARKLKLNQILNEMAEDIKYLKDKTDCPFPIMFPKSIVREWEK